MLLAQANVPIIRPLRTSLLLPLPMVHWKLPGLFDFARFRRIILMDSCTGDIKALILQVSQGGCAFFAGKGLPNDNQQASIIGLIDGAHHILAVATSYNVCVQRLYFRGTNIRSPQSVLTAQPCCTTITVPRSLSPDSTACSQQTKCTSN